MVCVGVLGDVVVPVDPRTVSDDDTESESMTDGDDIG